MNDLETITEVIRDLFDEYEGPVTRSLSAKDVEQWDSLANVQFAVLVEQKFGVRFTSNEVGKYASLGEFLDAIEAKRAARS